MIPIKIAPLFLLLLLAPFSTSTPFYRQTLTTPPDAYPYLLAQELLSMTPPVPYILQVAVEESLADDPTATSSWTSPKGQTVTMKDLLYEGVRSFQLDVHYISELDEGPGVTNAGFRVCKSVTSEVDVDTLCSGSLNDDLDIDLDEETCQEDGVNPDYGIHAGCRFNSPLLEDVLNAFDLFVGDGNPAAVILRFKDFTTGDFVDDDIDFLVQSQLERLIEVALAKVLFIPKEDEDYSDIDNWPSWKELIENRGRRVIIFSNSTQTSQVFDDSLLNEQNFDSDRRRAAAESRSTKTKRQSQSFFDYTIDASDQVIIQGTTISSTGEHIDSSDASDIVSDNRNPSIQRLDSDHLDAYVWGFEDAFDFDDTRECVMIDPDEDYKWFRTSCDENYAVACADSDSSNSFVFGEVTDKDYGSADIDSYCPSSTSHVAPTSPFSQEQLVASAISEGATGSPIYVNIRWTNVFRNRVVCGCDDGCWYLPGTSPIKGLPLTSFCVTPQIEIDDGDDDDDDVLIIADDDDDDLSSGEIAGIVLGSIFLVLLCLLILLLLLCGGRGTRFNEVSGRVGVMVEEEEEDERYKQSRGPLTTADTTAATTKEYPDHKMDLDAQVDMGLEEEEKGPANKRKIGALEVSSQSMRDYRSGLEEKK